MREQQLDSLLARRYIAVGVHTDKMTARWRRRERERENSGVKLADAIARIYIYVCKEETRSRRIFDFVSWREAYYYYMLYTLVKMYIDPGNR